jgi:hypothetical protein
MGMTSKDMDATIIAILIDNIYNDKRSILPASYSRDRDRKLEKIPKLLYS